MSPLACSLVALAALLATAHAGSSDQWWGHPTGQSVTLNDVKLPPNGGEVSFTNHCRLQDPYKQPVGEHVDVSNGLNDCDPVITGPWYKISVSCTPTPTCGCKSPITVYPVQYC